MPVRDPRDVPGTTGTIVRPRRGINAGILCISPRLSLAPRAIIHRAARPLLLPPARRRDVGSDRGAVVKMRIELPGILGRAFAMGIILECDRYTIAHRSRNERI